MMAELKGVLPVLHMPYLDDFTIDYAALQREVDFVYDHEVNGVVFALASELLRLTAEERRQVAAFLVKANKGRGNVTISVGAESTVAAIEFARHAESVGATAMMAIPPLATAASEASLRGYFSSILDATSIPLVVQDASAYVGNPMSVAFQAALLNDFGDRVRFKPEASPVGPLISALHAATGSKAQILEGSGGTMLVENYRRGVAGTMPGSDIIDAIVALWRALEAGDEDRIYALSPLIGAILANATGLDGFLAIEKHVLVRRGVFQSARVRGPVGFTLDEAATCEVDRLFDRLQAAL